MLKRLLFLFLILVYFAPLSVHAAGADLSLNPADIRFSKSPLVSGDTVRIYTKVQNKGDVDVTGYVTFYLGTSVIGDPQVISVVAGGNPEEAFVDFIVPNSSFVIRTSVSGTSPADINSDNNSAITGVFVPVIDDDHDGIPNATDNCPTTPNPDQLDTDHDGIGDACDDDIDGDGLTNAVETELGTNPKLKDSDGDGVDDAHDAYPLDPKRWILEKPVVKPVVKTQQKQVIKTALVSDPSEVTAPSIPVDQKEQSLSNVHLSSNAVFTYEKSSWNVFSFRLIAPVQDHFVYEWNFGDGVHSSKTVVSHKFVQAGTYHVTFKTTNQNEDISEESAEVNVTFFSYSNPLIVALLVFLGLTLIGSLIVLFKTRSKRRLHKRATESPLKQIHVKEE